MLKIIKHVVCAASRCLGYEIVAVDRAFAQVEREAVEAPKPRDGRAPIIAQP